MKSRGATPSVWVSPIQLAIVESRAVVASLISRFRVAPADSTQNRDDWFRDMRSSE